MDPWFATAGAVIAVLTAVIGGTVAIETRYAKAQQVNEQLDEYYAKQIKLRLLEIDLKPNPSPSDKALKQYLLQELTQDKK